MVKFTWKDWYHFGLYRKLYSLLGGRPWTYIYRDIWHKYEFFPQMQWFFMGVLTLYAAEHWFHMNWLPTVLTFWIIYTLGYINGHLFWGRRYIPDQREDDGNLTCNNS